VEDITTIYTYVWTKYRPIDKTIRLLPSFYKLKTIDDIAVSRKKRGGEQWLSQVLRGYIRAEEIES
jgi:hypothetical protein